MHVFLTEKGPRILAFLNAHAITTSERRPDFREFLFNADKLLRDGIGVKLALKIFGLGRTDNLNGTDLITLILKASINQKTVIFGASEETMRATAEKLKNEGHDNIAATLNGFLDDETYLAKILEIKPEIILLCMGMPRQENLAAIIKKSGFTGLVICGGGWADFYSGVKARAPLWMRRLGFEWFFRLMSEPRRLGKRYTVDIIYFFYVVIKDRYKGKA
jgi:hypothetical protein